MTQTGNGTIPVNERALYGPLVNILRLAETGVGRYDAKVSPETIRGILPVSRSTVDTAVFDLLRAGVIEAVAEGDGKTVSYRIPPDGAVREFLASGWGGCCGKVLSRAFEQAGDKIAVPLDAFNAWNAWNGDDAGDESHVVVEHSREWDTWSATITERGVILWLVLSAITPTGQPLRPLTASQRTMAERYIGPASLTGEAA